ncbi:hypothetical protein D3C72_2383190 [compost metagenome]
MRGEVHRYMPRVHIPIGQHPQQAALVQIGKGVRQADQGDAQAHFRRAAGGIRIGHGYAYRQFDSRFCVAAIA